MNVQCEHSGWMLGTFRKGALGDQHNDGIHRSPPSSCSVSVQCRGLLSAGRRSTHRWGSPYHLTHNLTRDTAPHTAQTPLHKRRTDSHPQAELEDSNRTCRPTGWTQTAVNEVFELRRIWGDTALWIKRSWPPAYRHSVTERSLVLHLSLPARLSIAKCLLVVSLSKKENSYIAARPQ